MTGRLISADALYALFVKMKSFGELTAKKAIRCVEEAPTVDAEPVRHGEWIGYPECLRYEKALTDDDYACSCCGEVFSCIDNDMERFDYCPHCGAKMDAQEDGECQTGLKEH